MDWKKWIIEKIATYFRGRVKACGRFHCDLPTKLPAISYSHKIDAKLCTFLEAC
jgi:hypothetical protein